MTNTKITAESFLDNKELREQTMARVEVLDKVKQLFLIPELECMTAKQVADYFEVPLSTVNDQFQHNRDEFESDGTDFKPLSSFKNLIYGKTVTQKPSNKRGSLTLAFIDGTEITIPNCGIKCFPKRAILRMGMLLRDSIVAKEVRTQLLNTFERATDEQRTTDIDEEKEIASGITAAIISGDIEEVTSAFTKYSAFLHRHIAKIEDENKILSEENEKIAAENSSLECENKILSADILKWTDRASANRLVRVLAGKCFNGDFKFAFNTIYKELFYRYGISLKSRRCSESKPLISYIRNDEWICLFKVAAAICNQNGIKVENLFEDAKIDTSGLYLE